MSYCKLKPESNMKPTYYILDEINMLECENRLVEFVETGFYSIFGHTEYSKLTTSIRANIDVVCKQIPSYVFPYTKAITLN